MPPHTAFGWIAAASSSQTCRWHVERVRRADRSKDESALTRTRAQASAAYGQEDKKATSREQWPDDQRFPKGKRERNEMALAATETKWRQRKLDGTLMLGNSIQGRAAGSMHKERAVSRRYITSQSILRGAMALPGWSMVCWCGLNTSPVTELPSCQPRHAEGLMPGGRLL